MSYANALTVLLLPGVVGAAGTVDTGTMCPPRFDDHPLERVEVFVGPPENLQSGPPGWGGWNLGTGPDSPEGMYLLCSFAGTDATQAIRLPKGVRGCWFGYNWPHVVCR